MLIKDLINKGSKVLADRENAVLEVEVLLCDVLGVGREHLVSHGDERVDDSLVRLFEQYIARVSDGEPVAYVIGEKEFYGYDFFVDKRVLVPRPETEMIVDKALEYLVSEGGVGRKFRILDVGTGSGNIVLSIVKAFDEMVGRGEALGEVYEALALDVSREALEVAQTNVDSCCLEDRVRVLESDLLECVEDGEKFDVIVTNLPYIGQNDGGVDKNVAKFEPASALYGGTDGLELYKKMFQQILEKGVGFGLMVGEFGFGSTEGVEKLLNKYFEQRWGIEKDLADIDRIFVVQ